MSLAERLKEAKAEAQKARLSEFEHWFEALDETDKRALLEAVQASELPIRALHDAVTGHEPPAKVGRDKFTSWLRANGYKR